MFILLKIIWDDVWPKYCAICCFFMSTYVFALLEKFLDMGKLLEIVFTKGEIVEFVFTKWGKLLICFLKA